uniref:DNA helicase n=1 Tax=Panagrellus redivivus TaxID=6233 RepID=A0A7E4USY3_PANRE
MATDRIACIINQCGLVATRDKLTLVRGDSQADLIANMYKTAPDVKVVYIFTMSRSYARFNATITSLKAVGFKNIKLVNTTSWFNTEQMQRSPVTCVVGECVAFTPMSSAEQPQSLFTVYKKTDEGYDQVGDSETFELSHFRKCPQLKHVVVLMASRDFSESEKALVKQKYPCQTVHFIGNKGRNWLKCIWDEYDEKVENFLPALFTLNLRFKYGNRYHLEKVDYSQLPFEKTFQLDIDNAVELETSVHYNFSEPELLKTYKLPPSKSRVLKITLKVSFEFVPEVVVAIVSEKDTVEGAVYSIDFVNNYQCNSDESGDDSESVDYSDYFTGTLITPKGAIVVVERSNDISDVFKQLDAKKGSAKLRGVFIDYPKHITFPLDTHRAVANALPSPKIKVCIGRTHSEWTIHLRNSGIKLKVGEGVVIANWITYHSPYKEYFYFIHTGDGFQVVEKIRGELPDYPFDTVVVIVKRKEMHFEDLARRLFPSKKVIFSERAKLPKNVRHDFAWQYFNGMNFYGYMVRPYRGVFFVARSGDHCDFIEKSCDVNCGTFENKIACLLEKKMTDSFYSSFYVFLSYVGYKEEWTVLETPMPKSAYVHLKVTFDEHFIPTATITEANSPLFPVVIPGGTKKRKNEPKPLKDVGKSIDKVEVASIEHMPVGNPMTMSAKVTSPDSPSKRRVAAKVKDLEKSVTDLNINKGAALPVETSFDINPATSNASDVGSPAEIRLSVGKPTVSDVSNVPSPAVILTFTHCNRVLIAAGSGYTGDEEFPAYLRLKYTNGTPEFLVGSTAKATTKKSRKHLIYDIPGLLTANSNRDRKNDAWTFDTSRADDGSLLVHLNAKDTTSPVVVFGHILRATLHHVNDQLPTKLERVGIRLPSEAAISKEDLSAISMKLGVDLLLL